MSLKDSEEVPEKGAMDKKEKEETEKKEADDTKKDEKDQDVVFVQDVGFTVKIIAPNLEPFDIQVTYFDFFLCLFSCYKFSSFKFPNFFYLPFSLSISRSFYFFSLTKSFDIIFIQFWRYPPWNWCKKSTSC